MIRTLSVSNITDAICALCGVANTQLNSDVVDALTHAYQTEEKALPQSVLKQILQNIDLSRTESIPACQDTGYAVLWIAVGQDVHLTGGDLYAAINSGVEQGYAQGYLRKSIVGDPLERKNTTTNTPAVIHTTIQKGDKVDITLEIKGGGSENMSRHAMLKPADGVEGVRSSILRWVQEAGGKPCPPIIVGIGIGGDFEQCAVIAKQALLRKVGSVHADSKYAQLEKELLAEINELDIGPAGLGGNNTALAVHIEARPCHIACLPVAMNLDCHAHRTKSIQL